MKLLRQTSVAAERLRLESKVQFRRSDRASDRVRTGGTLRRTEVGGFLDGAHDNSFSL